MPRSLPISVIVPACVRIEPLLKTLSKIRACVPGPDEILVHVDGASEAVVRAVQEAFPSVKLLSSPALLGPGGSRNKLIEAARHAWVANFDDDSFPEEAGYFARVMETAALFPDAAILSAANHDDPPESCPYLGVSEASGCGCVFHREWYQRVGGFVPLPVAYGMEEVDMGLRLHALGGVIVHDDRLRVIHDKPPPAAISPGLNAAILANTALFPFLRFPVWLWPVGLWQVLHRIGYLVCRGWTAGIAAGLRMIPGHLQQHARWRQTEPGSNILSWLVLRRFPKRLRAGQPRSDSSPADPPAP